MNRMIKIISIILSLSLLLCIFTSCEKPAVSVNPTLSAQKIPAEAEQTELQTEEADSSTTTEPISEEDTQTTVKKEPITEKPTEPIKVDSFQSLVLATARKYNAMGIQAATIVNGKVHANAEYGWAVANQHKMTADTKIRIASLSKTLVGMVVFRLIEDGVLSLESDISDYLGITVRNPSYPDVPITVHTILNHTSGLKTSGYTNSLEQLISVLQQPSAYTEYKPGEKYEYNNFAYGVLGTVCELATGKSFNTLTKEYFLDPLGIDASFIPAELKETEIAALYDGEHKLFRGVSTQRNQLKPTEEAGRGMKLYAGGLTISAVDFAKIITILMNDGMYEGIRFLSSESIAQIHTVQFMRPGSPSAQCMPVLLRKNFYGGRDLFHHTGSGYGAYTLYAYDPQTKTGVVVLTIGVKSEKDRYSIYGSCGDIARGVFEKNFIE